MTAVFNEYEKKRVDLMAKMQTLKEFEGSDEIVGLVFNISRQMLEGNGSRNQDMEWLLKKGNELAQYAGVLDGRANEKWGEYKVAEIAYKSVRDALTLANRSEYNSVTAAKAHASRATQDAEVDAIAREQKSKNYETAADICNRIVMFVQTQVRWRESEMAQAKINDRGGSR